MGAISVSTEKPSRRRCSSTLSASATISGPMPSPGRTAIFIRQSPQTRQWTGAAERRPEWKLVLALLCVLWAWESLSEEPRLLGFVLRLERANLVGVSERKADLVEAVEQAVLAKWLDLESKHRRAVGRRHRLLLEIDGQPE